MLDLGDKVMKTVKQSYNVFKVSFVNQVGQRKYVVINQTTNKIQSAWDSLIDARNVARDLNSGLNQRIF